MFYNLIIEYSTSAGQTSAKADSWEELEVELKKKHSPRASQEVLKKLEDICQEKAPFEGYLSQEWGKLMWISKKLTPGEWYQKEFEHTIFFKDGLLAQPIEVATVNLNFRYPIGSSENEISWRKWLAADQFEKLFWKKRTQVARKRIEQEFLAWVDDFIGSHTPKGAIKKYELHPESGELIFDVGGDFSQTTEIIQTFDRRGGSRGGEYHNALANPRAASLSEARVLYATLSQLKRVVGNKDSLESEIAQLFLENKERGRLDQSKFKRLMLLQEQQDCYKEAVLAVIKKSR